MESNLNHVSGVAPDLISHGGALALLGTVFVGAVAVLAAAVLLVRGRRRAALFAFAAAPAMLAFYAVALLAASLAGRDRVVGAGVEKYFCDLDCHVACAVLEVLDVPALEAGLPASSPGARFCVVTVRERFDETTTAAWRPRTVPVYPGPLAIRLIDDRGRTHRIAERAPFAKDRGYAPEEALAAPLLPGESRRLRFLFELPVGSRADRVLIHDSEVFHGLVIGDENSPWHGHTYFGR